MTDRYTECAQFTLLPRTRSSKNGCDGDGDSGRNNRGFSTATSVNSKINGNPSERMDSSEIEVAVVRASKEVECRRTSAKSSAIDTAHSWTISDSTLKTCPMSIDTIGGGISNATTCQLNSNTTTINGIIIDGDTAKLHRMSGESTKLIIQSPPIETINGSNQQRVNVISISSARECKPIEAPATNEIRCCGEQQRRQECHSSSDENRSSGHASMSDTGNGSSSPGCGNNNRENGGMLDVLAEDRLAFRSIANLPVEQMHELTIHSPGTSSTYSSLSNESETSEPAQNLERYSSLETVNTNVTTADSIVWIDNHNRLVELAHTPWNQQCIQRVIAAGRCRERISPEINPRLCYLLQVNR